MAIQTGLEGKPWYVSALAGLAFGAVLFFLGFWFFARPMKKEIEQKQGRLTELQAKIQEGRAAERQLPQFREEVRRLELQLDKLLRILPARRNTPELLRRIRALTEQGNFDLIQFRPGNFRDKDFYSEWPIFIQLNGTYHNLGMFFDRVSHFSRIVNVDNLNITALRGRRAGDHTIHATFTAKTFIYKEPPPAEETAAAGGQAGKGKGAKKR
jgi:type IV pilus assembly protein PilO